MSCGVLILEVVFVEFGMTACGGRLAEQDPVPEPAEEESVHHRRAHSQVVGIARGGPAQETVGKPPCFVCWLGIVLIPRHRIDWTSWPLDRIYCE